jgi:hypothetical protein
MHDLAAGGPSPARFVFKTVHKPIKLCIMMDVFLIRIEDLSITAMIFDLSLYSN